MAFHEYPYTDFHEMNLDWVIKKVKELTLAWAQTSSDWEELRTFVNDYFANLNVQEEINNKIDELVSDGTLSSLIAPYVASGLPAEVANQIAGVVAQQIGAVVATQLPAQVTEQLPGIAAQAAADEVGSWLEAHVDPSTGYVVDDSLTIQGAAADAKATGDAIDDLKSTLNEVADKFNLEQVYLDLEFTDGNFITKTKEVTQAPYWSYGSVHLTDTDKKYYANGYAWYNNVKPYMFVKDSDGTVIYPEVTGSSSATYYDYMEFTIPESGMLYVNKYGTSHTINAYYHVLTTLKELDPYEENIISNENYINQLLYNEIINMENSGYLNISGGYNDIANTYYISGKIKCKPGDVFYYKGNYGFLSAACAFYLGDTFVSAESYPSGLATREIEIIVPDGVNSVRFGAYQGKFTAYLKRVAVGSPLIGKKMFVFGDSFSHGDFSGYTDPEGHTGINSDAYDPVWGMYKTWVWFIGKRNNMRVINAAVNGAKTPYMTANNLYQTVPSDCDYVIFMLGLNDSSPTGTPDSTDPTTWYGAWNVTLNWLRENRPHARLGIICAPSWLGVSWRNLIESVAERHGVPVLNLYSDKKVPALLGMLDGTKLAKAGMDQAVSIAVTENNVVSSTNQHPNVACFEQMSDAIQVFMEGL